MTTRATRGLPAIPRGSRLGDRLRQLRVAAGLTQSDIARDRFSKEYISQIERGKTRPTPETIEWLALQLGVDSTFLASGVSSDERARAEAVLARAEALIERREYERAVDEYAHALGPVVATGDVGLQVRLLSGEAWARTRTGEVRTAIGLLDQARALGEGPEFSDLDRAEILFRLGVARYLISSIATALALFGEALSLAERSELPSDKVRADIFTWRSRCYRRQRDYEAARDDVERALELSEGMEDAQSLGDAYFEASLVAERDGHWVLARNYAERARSLFEEVAYKAGVGKMLNNLGGLAFLLGKPEEAIVRLQEAIAIGLEHGDDNDVATAVSSLAQVYLKTGDPVTAEEHARHALRRLEGREDRTDEIGNARLVLGRALLDQERLDEAEGMLAEAEDAFDQLSSGSHRAAAWVAQGDLAQRRGDDRQAAVLYRRAAEALQDFRF
ncbi:MAG TPA: tetratricopeptide repeat protein [Gaiellaceae bacterium]|jgi:tetratricopeptide (TPR) repeat protein/DNA-binding XRE family transcriptional regulator